MDDPTRTDTNVPDPIPPSSKPVSPPADGASQSKKDSKSFTIVVGAAVVIALVLMGIGYFAYRGTTQEIVKPVVVDQKTESSLDRSSPVDEQVVDSELQQIDEQVEDLDNQTDFNETELSDSELGL